MPGLAVNFKSLTCLLMSATAGALASYFHMPLAWVLGPLIVTATFAMADVNVIAPLTGRRIGQLIIGASVGLNLTASVLAELMGWLPVMIATALFAILAAAALSVVFARAARLDQPTAFFALMPGGMSEMANLGAAHGARSEPVAVSQALRVAVIVCFLPPLLILFGNSVDINAWTARPPVPPAILPLVFAAGGIGAFVFRLVGFQNPWMVGSLIGVAALSVAGLADGRLPVVIIDIGQFLLGIAIGARFKGDIVRHLPRLSIISIIFTIVLTVVMGMYAEAISALFDVGFATLMLSAAPGGFAEMVITAQVLHVQVTMVTAFHIVRSIIINGLVLHIWSLLNKIRFFYRINALFRRG